MATAANNRDDAVMLELKENGAVGTFEGIAKKSKGKASAGANSSNSKKTNLLEDDKETKVPKTFESFRVASKVEADAVIEVGLPTKILRVHNLIESAEVLKIHGPTDTGVDKVLKSLIEETALASKKGESKENEPDAKKRKLETGESASTEKPKPVVPSNKTLVSILLLLKEELLDGLKMLSTLKTWIQLNVPRIEDGDNFGVAVQEECAG